MVYKRASLLILSLSSLFLQGFAQFDDGGISLSYRLGLGKLIGQELDPASQMVPQAYLGGSKYCWGNDFDASLHSGKLLGASLQFGSWAYRLDKEAFEGNLVSGFESAFAESMVPYSHRVFNLAAGPTIFIGIGQLYIQGSGLAGTVIQRKSEYDVYLYSYKGAPSQTHQYFARGPLGWSLEGHLRIGFMPAGGDGFGFFIGGSYVNSLHRLKVTSTSLDPVKRSVDTGISRYNMRVQNWLGHIGIQYIISR
jgi:hypothetical protein